MLKIAICHQHIRVGDAIGHDIHGMYRLLTDMGFQVTLLGDYLDEATRQKTRYQENVAQVDADNFQLFIYHHSILWESGEALLKHFRGPIVLVYHNITPAAFFEPYSETHTRVCQEGRNQTRRLVKLFRDRGWWQAASPYNARELLDYGVRKERLTVVPPFNQLEHYLGPSGPSPGGNKPLRVLFVGRFAPNKGHDTLVRIIHAYVTFISPDIELTLVGAQDPNLSGYYGRVQALIDMTGVRRQIRILDHVSDQRLQALFRNSHAFLCTSCHEGFCVPVIEAQAAGVPVVSVDTAALADTIGEAQLVAPAPEEPADYLFFARLLRETVINEELRRQVVAQGHRNVLKRFTHQQIADRFIESLLPVLEDLS